MRALAAFGIVIIGVLWTVWLSLAIWLGRLHDEPRPVGVIVRKWVIIGGVTALLFAGSWWFIGAVHLAL